MHSSRENGTRSKNKECLLANWSTNQIIRSRFVRSLIDMADMAEPGGGYSHILAIRVYAAKKSMVFKPFGLV